MRTNGSLRYEIENEGELNEWGEMVVPQEKEWTTSYECQIETLLDNRQGVYEDGSFRQSSYSIMVEAPLFSKINLQTIKRISLEKEGFYLGEYLVQRADRLRGAGRIRLIV